MATSLEHLKRITNKLGVIQHCKYSIPDLETGFCLDDNARALIAVIMHYEQFNDSEVLNLASRYLKFINFTQREDGKFHNFVSYSGQFLDKEGSQDSFGRTIWACGYALASPQLPGRLRSRAHQIFLRAFPHLSSLESIRSQAFSIIGLYHYLRVFPEANTVREALLSLGEHIFRTYKINKAPSWQWFEDKLTYCNGRLPQALYLAYEVSDQKNYLQAAEEATSFLIDQLIKDGRLIVVGNRGWYKKGGKLAYFDQQPIDASCMVDLFKTAFKITGKESYKDFAKLSYEWFLGRNILGLKVCNPETGACYDGIEESGLNMNQGAESTICYLMADLAIRELYDPLELDSKVKLKRSKVQKFKSPSSTWQPETSTSNAS